MRSRRSRPDLPTTGAVATAGLPRKAEVRREVRTWLRSHLTPALRARWSASLRARLESLPEWDAAEALLVFRPLSDETDLWPSIDVAIAGGRRVFVPVVERGGLEFVRIDRETRWAPGPTTALEPEPRARREIFVPAGATALIVVPGLAFSSRGERLGRGDGFYDRALASFAGQLHSVGVAFEGQLRRSLPLEAHDLRVDRVVTEERILGRSTVASR